jgi:hypothetical protein
LLRVVVLRRRRRAGARRRVVVRRVVRRRRAIVFAFFFAGLRVDLRRVAVFFRVEVFLRARRFRGLGLTTLTVYRFFALAISTQAPDR